MPVVCEAVWGSVNIILPEGPSMRDVANDVEGLTNQEAHGELWFRAIQILGSFVTSVMQHRR